MNPQFAEDRYFRESINAIQAEVILTAIILYVILGSTDKHAPKGFAGLAIGLTLTLIHLVSIPITHTSVNPARSIGVGPVYWIKP